VRRSSCSPAGSRSARSAREATTCRGPPVDDIERCAQRCRVGRDFTIARRRRALGVGDHVRLAAAQEPEATRRRPRGRAVVATLVAPFALVRRGSLRRGVQLERGDPAVRRRIRRLGLQALDVVDRVDVVGVVTAGGGVLGAAA
jgi:hypothetical protein